MDRQHRRHILKFLDPNAKSVTVTLSYSNMCFFILLVFSYVAGGILGLLGHQGSTAIAMLLGNTIFQTMMVVQWTMGLMFLDRAIINVKDVPSVSLVISSRYIHTYCH